MKKYIKVVAVLLAAVMLIGCSKKEDNTEELKKYKAEMSSFFNKLESADKKFAEIDAENQESIHELNSLFDELEGIYKELADIEVPKDFSNNEELADQAYEYMVQANEYLKQAFTDNSYNTSIIDASIECYRRANKRVQFIISILHGETPTDSTITYQQ